MKRAFLAGLLSVAMTVSMMAGTVSAAGTAAAVSAQDETAQAEDRSWDFTAASSMERPTLEGGTGEYDGIQIETHRSTQERSCLSRYRRMRTEVR